MHSEWVSKESVRSIPETLKQSQQQQQAPKTKEKLIMVSPPGFNNFIVNELHQHLQNFQGVILDILVQTSINTPRINIS